MEKLIIFDLDGTLLDTLPDITYNLNLALKKFGYNTVDIKTVYKYIGFGAKELVKGVIDETLKGKYLSEEDLNKSLDCYNELYTSSVSPYTKFFKGIKRLLKKVKKRGYKLAILTNKPQNTTDRIYGKFLKKFKFDIVVGESENVKCKPDKTAALDILKKFGVEKENAYMIGDGETDAVTAINAGINGISVLWGYRDKEFLSSYGAKTFVSTPKELLKILK